MLKTEIPNPVREVMDRLIAAGFEAYAVGGCVRDTFLKRKPKDWDVTTNAKPEDIQKIFAEFAGGTPEDPATVYENDFGTVGIKTESEDPIFKIIEVTTYRIEGKYSDQRHPDEVVFVEKIEEDLARRDFTVNAMAMDLKGKIVDPFQGEKDLQAGFIRAVGEPEDRFREDALRLMRAVRFATELNFQIEPKTRAAIQKLAGSLSAIATERIRDEFMKLLMAENAAKGVIMLEELDLLKHVLPELREGLSVSQDKHHIYDVFEHSIRALDYAARQNYSLEVRLASLLHDVGKPRTKAGESPNSTFYNHEMVGAKMAARALDRLHLKKEMIEQVAHLVRWHMFYYNVGEVSAAGVRRFLRRVGPENIDDLIKVREADRIGSGVPKAVPYKLRHLLFMIEKVKHDPISPKMLKINGEDVMKTLNIAPGPKVGAILAALLEEVLDDPKRNESEYLLQRVEELNKLNDKELQSLLASARDKKNELEGEAEAEMKKKFRVS